ncbi:MAG TPA: hypothetical protein VFC14_04290 [Burkholderiales bacterium]|nr:hypothetical protein [Burkholderiales bacterium]
MHFDGVHLYDQSHPVLRAISPLAEGTDRLFAEQALEAGYTLCCIMPFQRAEYERDFAAPHALEADSLSRFRQLLGRAASSFQLDGDRSDEGAPAYGAGGRMVLNQSDLLLVVWDGERQGKRGGTEETLDEAQRQGVPIVWVDARAPHGWQLIVGGTGAIKPAGSPRAMPVSREASLARPELQRWVRQALDLPQSTADSSHRQVENPKLALCRFYSERQPGWSAAVVWGLFRDIVGEFRAPRRGFRVNPFEEDSAKEWDVSDPPSIGALLERLRPFYAWPDKLAVLCSDRYRSVFILSYLLAALAVGMALLPVAAVFQPHGTPETLAVAAELVAILAILVMVVSGVWRRWHARWIDYRLAAELVRHLRLVAPLGGGRPYPQIPAHWAIYGQSNATWMSWYVRSVERALGLPNAAVDRGYLRATLKDLHGVLSGQASFHQAAADRAHNLEHRLHAAGIALLCLTLAACFAHLVPGLGLPEGSILRAWIPESPHLLIFFGGFFPALGASLAGIVNQGEFRRIAKRSASMAQHLGGLVGEVDGLLARVEKAESSVALFMGEAMAIANNAARLLINEVLDWRVVLLDRPLEPPA